MHIDNSNVRPQLHTIEPVAFEYTATTSPLPPPQRLPLPRIHSHTHLPGRAQTLAWNRFSIPSSGHSHTSFAVTPHQRCIGVNTTQYRPRNPSRSCSCGRRASAPSTRLRTMQRRMRAKRRPSLRTRKLSLPRTVSAFMVVVVVVVKLMVLIVV